MEKFQPVLELLLNKSIRDFQDAYGKDYELKEGFNYDDFNNILKAKLCLDVEDSDVHHLFCQIDRYSKGNVTYTELDNYFCEYEKRRKTTPEGLFEMTPTMYTGVRSRDSIIEWILYPQEPGISHEIADHYFFVSKRGIISVFNKDMEKKFETTIKTADDLAIGKATTGATSLTCLPRERLVAVATTAGDIRFFRSSIYKFEHSFSIVYFPYIVLRIDCHASEKLVCGDFSGNIFIIQMDKNFFAKIHNRANHTDPEKILFKYLKMGKIPGLLYESVDKSHFSPVQKVAYIASLMAVISCSLNSKRAMMVHHLKNNESLVFACQGGIICFAFCDKLNYIFTGGADLTIKRWNPSFNSTYSESLTGHIGPVDHMLVFDDRQVLISADREKMIRVWDLVRPQCLQVIHLKKSGFVGKLGFSFIFLDPTNGDLILTTYKIGKLKYCQATLREKTHPCSQFIVLASYSSVYNCMVTVGNSSTISTWDADTGSLIYEFSNSHTVLDSFGMPHNMGILKAGLDPSGRRLVTADRTGVIKVWNFHLGVCLKSFKTNCTILSLTFSGFHIYVAGTSKVVIDLYDNGSENVEPIVWDKHHNKSIVSLDCYGRDFLSSASGDGELIIWFRRTADAKIQVKDLKEDENDVPLDDAYLAKREIEERRKCSISQVLFLQTREMDFLVGNLVSCSANGRICFWNIVCKRKFSEGKLLSKFKAVFGECHGVLCLATDTENRYLISGDTVGYVRIYDLENYYDRYGSSPSWKRKASPEQLAKFPFLKLLKAVEKEQSRFCTDPEVGFSPILLNCFRAHLVAIMRISYVCDRDLLITGSTDSSVRLWALSGTYLGLIGASNEPWGFLTKESDRIRMPPDIKSVVSYFTLFVLNNGTTPLWSRAMKALRRCRWGNQPEDFSEKQLKWKGNEVRTTQEMFTYVTTIEKDLANCLTYFQQLEKKCFKI